MTQASRNIEVVRFRTDATDVVKEQRFSATPTAVRARFLSNVYPFAMDLHVETEREEDGRWIADVPEIPGVLAYGATEADATAKASALALRVVADRIEHGEAHVDAIVFRDSGLSPFDAAVRAQAEAAGANVWVDGEHYLVAADLPLSEGIDLVIKIEGDARDATPNGWKARGDFRFVGRGKEPSHGRKLC